MKKRLLISTFLLFSLSAFVFTACRLGTNLHHDPPIYDTNHARAYYPGLLINFPAAPTEGMVGLFSEFPVRKVSDTVYVIEKYDRHNAWHGYALEQALREHATLTGWKPAP